MKLTGCRPEIIVAGLFIIIVTGIATAFMKDTQIDQYSASGDGLAEEIILVNPANMPSMSSPSGIGF
jgi:hypothetical protein